jgi:hypothetical protein
MALTIEPELVAAVRSMYPSMNSNLTKNIKCIMAALAHHKIYMEGHTSWTEKDKWRIANWLNMKKHKKLPVNLGPDQHPFYYGYYTFNDLMRRFLEKKRSRSRHSIAVPKTTEESTVPPKRKGEFLLQASSRCSTNRAHDCAGLFSIFDPVKVKVPKKTNNELRQVRLCFPHTTLCSVIFPHTKLIWVSAQ